MARENGKWEPPNCPFPDCDSHADSAAWRHVKKGFYSRQAFPQKIQRYRCSHCQRSFSSQTFSTTYWLRLPQLQRIVFARILGCSGYRQIAWEVGVAHSTIQRHVERLGRHCLLLHEALRPRNPPCEPVVLDGFRSFEFGQYWPFDLNLLIGRSHFVYGFQDAELRRMGSMTGRQRRRRIELEAVYGRPDPAATRRSIEELITRIIPVGSCTEVLSDRHNAYPTAFRALNGRSITHRRFSSHAPRTPQNPLFPANLADLLIRHSSANHKRETIAFSKRRQNAMYRVAIWTVVRNYVKPGSIRRRSPPPGVAIGSISSPWDIRDVLRVRLFPWKMLQPGWLKKCYFGCIPTRRIASGRKHSLRYAT